MEKRWFDEAWEDYLYMIKVCYMQLIRADLTHPHERAIMSSLNHAAWLHFFRRCCI